MGSLFLATTNLGISETRPKSGQNVRKLILARRGTRIHKAEKNEREERGRP